MASIDGFLIPFEEDPHWPFIESAYNARYDLPGEDVGEPLILTPYIKEQKLMEARQAARVNDTVLLPGIESYAGYLTVRTLHIRSITENVKSSSCDDFPQLIKRWHHHILNHALDIFSTSCIYINSEYIPNTSQA